MNSSRRLLGLGLEKYKITLPSLGEIVIYIKCSFFDETARDVLTNKETQSKTMIAYIPAKLCTKYSLDEILTASLSAYTLMRHRVTRIKKTGLEVLRILCRERNIDKAIKKCGAKPRENIVTVIISDKEEEAKNISERLVQKECYVNATASRESITSIAVYPIEERLYKLKQDRDTTA